MMKTLLFFSTILWSVITTSAQPPVKIVMVGKGRPILLLPGFATPGSVWDRTIKNLPPGCQTHTATYAGFGGVAPIATPWYDQVRSELVAYIHEQGLTNLVIIGHSMGGNLAVELAAEVPEHISGLILIESIPCMRELMMPGVDASSLQYQSPYNDQVISMSDNAFRQMASGLAQNMTTDPSKVEQLTMWTTQADRKTYVYGYTDLLKLDLRETLKMIRINTLILGAAFPDKELVRTNYEKQYKNLSSKQISIADNCRHFVMFDQPEWMETQINTYLQPDGQR
jgi:pimeloyl-ACP methyl ester carboxylesterase